MVILLGVSVHYFFQPRYIIQNGMCYPHSRQFSCHLLELKMNLDEIEEIYPNFTAPCVGGEHYLFTEPEAIDKLVSITKLTMGKLLWYLTLKKYWCCDYSSNERNKLPTSHFFGRLPGKGTYLKNGEFFEISDNGFSLVIDVIDDVPIYRLKSEYDPISISNLDKGHFQYYKTIRKGGDYIRKRISLPFGTYLYPWGNSYYIISVLPN